MTGFISYDRTEGVLPRAALEFLAAGAPPVIFTPGTANRHAARFFSASVEACRLTGRRGILLTGHREQVPAALPENAIHFPYLPFSSIFPHAAAVAHHGGIGTCAQALAAGVPQLMMPMAFDQPDNAARLERLGVAAWLYPEKYLPAAVAEELNYLISSAEVKKQCETFAKKVDFNVSLESACRAIEQALSCCDTNGGE